MRSWILLFAGIISCSSSAIFIKSSMMHPAYLAALRLLIASVILLPFFLKEFRKHRKDIDVRKLWLSALPGGLLLALHFISWNEGARRTLAIHATLIVNMIPVVMPLILWITLREKLQRMEWLATFVSAIGIGWLAVHDYHFSREYLVGDAICFLSMVLFAYYLSFGRKNREARSILLYMVPLYLIAGLICLIISLFDWRSLTASTPNDYLMAFCLAIIPTIAGHTLINHAMRTIRGQVVAVLNLSQFIFAGFFAFVLWKEIPEWTFVWVSGFVIFSCILGMQSHRSSKQT